MRKLQISTGDFKGTKAMTKGHRGNHGVASIKYKACEKIQIINHKRN